MITLDEFRWLQTVNVSIKPLAVNQSPMDHDESVWAYDRRDIQPNECRQYLSPIDESTADYLSRDRRTTAIMDALEWKTLSQKELDAMFPDSEDLIETMRKAGIIRPDGSGWTLAEPYYGRCRDDDVYWFLTSEKREWGLSMKEDIQSIAEYLIALKFQCIADDPVRNEMLRRIRDEDPDRISKAADGLFATIARLISDKEPEELFDSWTSKTTTFAKD